MNKHASYNRLVQESKTKRGRPTFAEVEQSPPVPIEETIIQPEVGTAQGLRIGLRSPPCCGTAMVPRVLSKSGEKRRIVQCTACGKRLSIQYGAHGSPELARVL